jgi:hypothetical protein
MQDVFVVEMIPFPNPDTNLMDERQAVSARRREISPLASEIDAGQDASSAWINERRENKRQ